MKNDVRPHRPLPQTGLRLAEIDRALKVEEVRQRLANLGVETAGGSPAQFAVYLREELTKWSRLIKEIGLRVESQ